MLRTFDGIDDVSDTFINVIKLCILLSVSFLVGIIAIYYIDSNEINIHYNDPERAEYNRFLRLEQKTIHEQSE